MSFSTFIARRYMQAGRGNRFFSWISVLTISGVAIGVAAMIVVWSVINGFETELRQRFLAANSHVMAYRFPHGLVNASRWEGIIREDFGGEIKGMAPFIHYETMGRNESIMHSILVRGIHPKARESVQSLKPITRPTKALDTLQQEIKAQRKGNALPETPSVIVGTGLLSLLEAEVGDTIELIEPEKKRLGDMKSFEIAGVYDSGLKHYDNKLVIMSIPAAQKFFHLGDRIHGLEIGLHEPWNSDELSAKMAEKYTLSIREWQSFNRPLFEAMQMERVVILLITGLVAAVAGFNILTTIFVAVSQRQRDISILKALGASNRQILGVFVKQGVYVGVVGSLIGMVLAVIISAVLERYQFIDLPDLYLLAELPISYDWWVYASIGAISVLIAMAAGFFPALKASRVDPVEGFGGVK